MAIIFMATFISPQVVSALLGINLYATHELKDQYGLCFVVLCTSPILVLICDSLMIFYRPMESYLPDRLVIFMVQYEALRKISEFALETIPQSVLQIVLFFVCASTVECGFEAAEEVGMYMHDSGNLSVIYLVQLVFANIFFPPVFFFLHTYIVVTPYQI